MPMQIPESLAKLQDRFSALLGCAPDERPHVVMDMLRRNPSESAGYWLQLVVSTGIATLGLVLGSTAVIIGAMLIAPLMGPIVGFGMGLAVGSPFLVLRSGARVLLSVVLVIGCSALLTRMLPFHEINPEIASRTTPTALDLVTAGFCALAGVYATMRRSPDMATTAAGTSIGISLVPPLCTSGFGVGTLSSAIAGGAALLFLTNFAAIVVVGTVAFAMAGFHRENVHAAEASTVTEVQDSPIIQSLAKRLGEWFKGPWLRLMMPLVLLAAVYIPLRAALDEVVWEVRVRAEAQSVVSKLSRRVIESRVRVERHEVEVLVVLLGTAAEAEAARSSLDASLRSVAGAGVTPRVEVMAVPDAAAFAGLEAAIHKPILMQKPPEPALPERVELLRAALQKEVAGRFPSASGGKILSVGIDLLGDTVRLEIIHLGAPIGVAGVEMLEKELSQVLEKPVKVQTLFFPPGEQTPEGDDPMGWLMRLSEPIVASRRVSGLSVCAVQPKLDVVDAKKKKGDAQNGKNHVSSKTAAVLELMDQWLSGHPRASVTVVEGGVLSLKFIEGSCPPVTPPPKPEIEGK